MLRRRASNPKGLTIDGGAVVLRPDALSRVEERRRPAAPQAILCAFDLIEQDGPAPSAVP